MERVRGRAICCNCTSEDIYSLSLIPSELLRRILSMVDGRDCERVAQAVIGMQSRIRELSPAPAAIEFLQRKEVNPQKLELILTQALEKGQPILKGDKNGMTLLHHAVDREKPDYIPSLLRHDLGINDRDGRGLTPLHLAMFSDSEAHFACLQVLIANGALLDVPDDLGLRPLHYAASLSSWFVKALLDAGADPNTVDWEGRTPLHHAALLSSDPDTAIKCLTLLLEAGADLYAEETGNRTALMVSRFPEVRRHLQDWQNA